MSLLQITLYISLLILLAGIIFRTVRIARMPMHLRWDLYPMPHEKGKSHYGGSYYEETDWWTKPREKSFRSEIGEMGREIFTIQTLYQNKRGLWYFSFPFHLGLYFLTAFTGLLILSAIIHAYPAGSLDIILNISLVSTGVLGFISGLFGSGGLLVMRLSKRELRNYSTRADYFNLILLLAIFFCGTISLITVSNWFGLMNQFARDFLTLKKAAALPHITNFLLILTALFFAYMPFTHMIHFVGKYYTYHKVRWQDDPIFKGSNGEIKVIKSLGNIQHWSASHIKHDNTWADAAIDIEQSEKGGIADGS